VLWANPRRLDGDTHARTALVKAAVVGWEGVVRALVMEGLADPNTQVQSINRTVQSINNTVQSINSTVYQYFPNTRRC
jgi:hypothetical protein